MSTVVEQPFWPTLKPHIRIEVYGRDGGPHKPRFRIEVDPPTKFIGREWALTFKMPCVACGREIEPIRSRNKWKTFYFAATCHLSHNLSCARSAAASAEYQRVRAEVGQ